MSNLAVANTILEQIGGRRFIIMTGATNFLGDQTSLRFRIPRAQNGIRFIKVTLTPMDTYLMEFLGVQGNVIEKVDDVYFDQLEEIFSKYTGLSTRV
jgi:hypothetical protein